MTSFEFNSTNTENYVKFNKGITQIIGDFVASTLKKDYSFINLSNQMKVIVEGKVQNKKVVTFFTELGYTIAGQIDATEEDSSFRYIFTK